MKNENLSKAEAYDVARKEFYEIRHEQDIERRVAKEEAVAVGAYFGMGPLEIGMQLEDQKYEEWREWAIKEIAAMKQMQGAAYSGSANEEMALSDDDPATQAGLDEVEDSVPGSRKGRQAFADAPAAVQT